MERTARDIEAQIAKLEAAKLTTQARNGRQHYQERINYLRGELMLRREADARQTTALWYPDTEATYQDTACVFCGTTIYYPSRSHCVCYE